MHKQKSSRLREAYKIYSKILSVFNFIKNKITRSFSVRVWTNNASCVTARPYH